MRVAEASRFDATRGEVLIESAQIHAMLGDRTMAEGLLLRARAAPSVTPVLEDVLNLVDAELAVRRQDATGARVAMSKIDTARPHPTSHSWLESSSLPRWPRV